MPGQSFVFKQFIVKQQKCAMKVGTDAVLLGAWANLPDNGRILDVGTGTGIIALMVAQRTKGKVDAVEINADAYTQAVENCSHSKWSERISVYHNSFQQFSAEYGKKYDVVISNPPYFSNSLQAASEQRTQARHTCTLKFEELLKGGRLLLKKEGSFATILPPRESNEMIEVAKGLGLYISRITRVQTFAANQPKRILMQFGFKATSFSENVLIIKDTDTSYSLAYKNLTRDFYLGL